MLTRKKTPSNKTQVPTKSTHMDIWAIGTLNQLFIREVLILELNLQKKQSC